MEMGYPTKARAGPVGKVRRSMVGLGFNLRHCVQGIQYLDIKGLKNMTGAAVPLWSFEVKDNVGSGREPEDIIVYCLSGWL